MAEENKGKGKAPSNESTSNRNDEGRSSSSTTSSSGRASSAAQSLASALRTTMASSQLGSLMQGVSGGKAEFAPSAGASGDLRDWLVQDLRSSSGGSGSGFASQASRPQTFRSVAAGGQSADQQQMFNDFSRGLMLENAAPTSALETDFTPRQTKEQDTGTLNQAWVNSNGQDRIGRAHRWSGTGLDPGTAQLIGSYTDLDSPLHAAVRDQHTSGTRSSPNTADVSTRAYPRGNFAPLAETDEIFSLLDQEGSSHSPAFTSTATAASTSSHPTQLTTEALSDEVLSRFDPNYRPPSPSNTGFSRDQATMHMQLAEAQASEQGRQELLIPRPDNQATREGVYAATAEDALKSIFEGRQESSDVTETETEERGAAVVKKITKYFAGSSYLDDVYGLPPLLRETIEEAVKGGPGDEEKRERAVRRLESLWNHLSNTKPAPVQSSDWVDGWLRNNT